MSPSTAAAVADPPSSPPVRSQNVQLLPIELLSESPLNPRKHFDEAKLQELANSFRGSPDGIIENLVVRRDLRAGPHEVAYEIVAGARRFRAAKLAKLTHVPATVRELTDDQVLEIMVIENNQREDVNALEEAEGFHQLLKRGWDPEKLAERLGRSKKYVYDRIKLLDLVPTAKQLVLDGLITPGHAILLARLKAPDQERAIDPGPARDRDRGGLWQVDRIAREDGDGDEQPFMGLKTVSVRELDAWIAGHVRFDPIHAAQAAPLDFGETADKVTKALAQPGRGKKVIPITFEYHIDDAAKDPDGNRTYGARSFRFADGQEHVDEYQPRTYVAKTCEHSVLGVVVVGREHYGRTFEVCIARDKCEVHWKKEIAEKAKNQKLRESGQAKKAEARERKQEETWKAQQRKAEEERRAWEAVLAKALPAFAEHLKGQKVTPDVIRRFVWSGDLGGVEKLTGPLTDRNMGQVLALLGVLHDIHGRDAFMKAVKPYGFNLAPFEKPAQTSAQPKATLAAKKAAKAKKPARKAAKKR